MLVMFFVNDTATTEIYTLSLHDALPICARGGALRPHDLRVAVPLRPAAGSEEHTSELQSPKELVCRLLLEKKNQLVDADYTMLVCLSQFCLIHLPLAW